MTTPPPRKTGGYQDRPDIDDDAAQSTDYDGGLRAAAEGGRVAMFRGTGPSGSPAQGPRAPRAGAERPVSGQPAPEVDSPFMGLFDEPPRDRPRALEPGPGRAE